MEEKIKIKSLKLEHSTCNSCKKKPVNGKLNEIIVGKNGEYMIVLLCTKCLNELADTLWQYLENDGETK